MAIGSVNAFGKDVNFCDLVVEAEECGVYFTLIDC